MQPKPRNGSFYGAPIYNSLYDNGTWLEGEEFAYPNGGYTHRAYAKCDDGKYRVFQCSIADTLFSIPARGRIASKYVKGFLSVKDETLCFTQT